MTLADKAEQSKTIIHIGPFTNYADAVDHLPAAHSRGRRLGYEPWTGEIRLTVRGRKHSMELSEPSAPRPAAPGSTPPPPGPVEGALADRDAVAAKRIIVWWTEAYKAPVELSEDELAYLRDRGIDLETYLYDTLADWTTGPDVKSTSFEIFSITDGDPSPDPTAPSFPPADERTPYSSI